MFNAKQFEEKLYTLVTQEVNQAVTLILIGGKENVQTQGIQLQRQVTKALHDIVEETSIQILYGLLAYMGSKDP